MRNKVLLIMAVVISEAGASPVIAAEDDRNTIYGRGGFFYSGSDTRVRLDDPNTEARGAELDLEGDLDFETGGSVLQGEIGVRLSNSWAVEFGYFELSRFSNAFVGRTIKVEDKTFPVNSELTGGFGSAVHQGKVVWRVADWEDGDFSLSLGIHATDFKISLAGEAEAPGGGTRFASISKTKLAPLPTIGAIARFDIASDVEFFVEGEVFALEVKNVRGSLVDAESGLRWNFSDHIGVGGSFRLLHYRVNVDADDILGSINYSMVGPMTFVTFQF
jgi:hypothetical protein